MSFFSFIVYWFYSFFIEYNTNILFLDTDDDEDKSPKSSRQFSVGELVWGPHGTFPSWPGKLVRFERDGSKVLVCWFGNRDTSQVNSHSLKSLSDGLEAHHRERKKLRKWVVPTSYQLFKKQEKNMFCYIQSTFLFLVMSHIKLR